MVLLSFHHFDNQTYIVLDRLLHLTSSDNYSDAVLHSYIAKKGESCLAPRQVINCLLVREWNLLVASEIG